MFPRLSIFILACLTPLTSLLATPFAYADPLHLPVTRDTWFSTYKHEADCNLGGSGRLKVKSIQEMSLLDFDPASLKGRVVQSATLHIRVSGKEFLRRVTVGSFGAEWVEGKSPQYAEEPGASTFNHREHPDVPWSFPGSDLCSVILGSGGTIWASTDVEPPDADGWQAVPVDPRVIGARVAGISHGLFLFDDTGSEWKRDGEKFERTVYPNRFLYSSNARPDQRPYLTVELSDEKDSLPPAKPTNCRCTHEGLPDGECDIEWTVPKDAGPAGTIGFFVKTTDGKTIPRYLIPAAKAPGEQVIMRLRDMPEDFPRRGTLEISAVDAAGNIGEPAQVHYTVSARTLPKLPSDPVHAFKPAGELPSLAGAKVSVIDPLDKVHPVSGKMIPDQPDDYRRGNHLFSAEKKLIRLPAAKGETVAFQILIDGPVRGVQPSVILDDEKTPAAVEFFRFRYVNSKSGPLPDPCLPISESVDLPDPKRPIPNQRFDSLLCEIHIPHDAKPGRHPGRLILETGEETLELSLLLWIWDFHLPDSLSFLPEMNCYGLPSNERDYYRLAHAHRTVLNRLSYHQNGSMAEGCAPKWDGKRLDWTEWDKRFGPYFDGSAFEGLLREGVPIELFYLPLHENWPSPMEGNYNGDYWADRAFPESYRDAFVEASRQIAAHLKEKGWNDTLFQCYLNNKVDFKSNGWSRGSSPWLLDEPANFQDYWALRYFGVAFHEGVNKALGTNSTGPRAVFRGDISRPQWQRDCFDDILDYNVVGGSTFKKYHRLVTDRKERLGQIVVPYGTTNAIEESNMQPVGWSLDSWTLGGDGVLPWQTVGRGESWQEADQLSLFYPGPSIGLDKPIASIRLKAYRRGQQDVEYLTLLAEQLGEPRWAVGAAVRQALDLKAEHKGTGFTGGEDAGTVHFTSLKPQDIWKLRVQIARFLSEKALPRKRRLIDLHPPRRNPGDCPSFLSERERD